jgi:hypothetical protein
VTIFRVAQAQMIDWQSFTIRMILIRAVFFVFLAAHCLYLSYPYIAVVGAGADVCERDAVLGVAALRDSQRGSRERARRIPAGTCARPHSDPKPTRCI